MSKRPLLWRIACSVLGHRWLGCWKRHPTDREFETAEYCSRCHLWRSLLGGGGAK